jgi:lysozyme
MEMTPQTVPNPLAPVSPFTSALLPLNSTDQAALDQSQSGQLQSGQSQSDFGTRSLQRTDFDPDSHHLVTKSQTHPKSDQQRPKQERVADDTDQLTGLKRQTKATLPDADRNADDRETTRSRAAALPFPGRLLKYVPGAPLRFDRAAQQWQARMQQRGWSIQVDGLYGAQSARICRQFQQEKGLQADGIVGAATWAAAFRSDNLATPQPSPGGTSSINQKGLDLIKKFEGLVLTAYRDPVGIWTIGYGHTGPEVGPGDVITRAQAESLLKRDLLRFENAVRSLVKVPVNSNQFSALVSFTYNVGSGALAQSTLLALLNQRNYQGAANQFPRWVNGGGGPLPGLVRRRNEERALFLTPA